MTWLYELEFAILHGLQKLHTPVLDWLMVHISFLGNSGWLFILLGGILLAFKRTRKTGFAVLLSLFAGLLIGNLFLKNLVMRSRPCWLDQAVPLLLESPSDFSFPSGHTLASFETAVSIFLYHKGWGCVMLLLAAAIAFSRLYLFVHFPTDVLCGMGLGILIAWCVHRIMENRTSACKK